MILDEKLELLDGYTLASLATTVDSNDATLGDVIDFGEGMEDLNIGAGTPMWLNIQIGALPESGELGLQESNTQSLHDDCDDGNQQQRVLDGHGSSTPLSSPITRSTGSTLH